MASCEKCWRDAGGNTTVYMQLLEERKATPCTEREQAGQWWNEELRIDSRCLGEHSFASREVSDV